MKSNWPKKQRLADYAKHNFTDPDSEKARLVKACRAGDLPAVKEGKLWYVWVLPDNTPAYGYSQSGSKTKRAEVKINEINTGNALADAVLLRKALKEGADLR